MGTSKWDKQVKLTGKTMMSKDALCHWMSSPLREGSRDWEDVNPWGKKIFNHCIPVYGSVLGTWYAYDLFDDWIRINSSIRSQEQNILRGPLTLYLAIYKGKICRILTKLEKKKNQSLNPPKKLVIQHPFKNKSLVTEIFIHFHGDPEILSEGLSESSY